jgi:hypothetical protein
MLSSFVAYLLQLRFPGLGLLENDGAYLLYPSALFFFLDCFGVGHDKVTYSALLPKKS